MPISGLMISKGGAKDSPEGSEEGGNDPNKFHYS